MLWQDHSALQRQSLRNAQTRVPASLAAQLAVAAILKRTAGAADTLYMGPYCRCVSHGRGRFSLRLAIVHRDRPERVHRWVVTGGKGQRVIVLAAVQRLTVRECLSDDCADNLPL